MEEELKKDAEQVYVSLKELIQLNEIKIKHQKFKFEKVYSLVEIIKKLQTLTFDTSIEEMEKMQELLKSNLDNMNKDLKDCENEKKFVQEIMDRNTKK